MPWDHERFTRTFKLKRLIQSDLTVAAGVSQGRLSQFAKEEPSLTIAENLATRLDCSIDFLTRREYPNAEKSDETFRAAISEMAFEVFKTREGTTEWQRERCRRVLGHRTAPVTADGWSELAEQIDRAVPPPTDDTPQLRAIEGGKSF